MTGKYLEVANGDLTVHLPLQLSTKPFTKFEEKFNES